ncbi:MAG: signal peptide protein, YSIRK family [Lentilactobacillus buchneri]|jgi:hypothetical protein|uniref:signal peptide protein, YSIRK family n=1 Tax=Lentilactobacillus hilgardii TaxID=1588 RepID=UPI003E779A08|nr:signal peptide protein, YSIRK family [Lentilactobacillus buchneri]MCI1950809.1 signal peptide protein, YSIRK family [Lentilactobacillus buchneri]MCI2019367.1 signal peptide protein, YSIRK family [Lentilactobacillus buchneri]MCI2028061.1 signal peptide protein, YSIRK family [Lentilactobacillus buchneri]
MKKFGIIFATIILALPLFAAVSSTSASAAKAKTYSFSILTADFYDKLPVYHTNDHTVTVYRAAIGADNPSISFTAKGKLKPSTNYHVTRYVKAKSNATKKIRSFLYVKGHGWIQSVKVTKGALNTDNEATKLPG